MHVQWIPLELKLNKLHTIVIIMIDICICHAKLFPLFFCKGHSPLNLKLNHHRKVTNIHTVRCVTVYAIRNTAFGDLWQFLTPPFTLKT